MSARNGDKSRFNRKRKIKMKIARRKRNHEIVQQATTPHRSGSTAGPRRESR